MSTPKQLKAASKTLENIRSKKPKAMSKVLEDSGYSKTIATTPSAVTRSKGYQEALAPLLKKHNITMDRYITVISDALDATKTVVHGNKEDSWVEVVPDHNIRLAANKQAKELLPVPKEENKETPRMVPGELDEIQALRYVFKGSKIPVDEEKGTSHNIKQQG